jgi:hypothetical protein
MSDIPKARMRCDSTPVTGLDAIPMRYTVLTRMQLA